MGVEVEVGVGVGVVVGMHEGTKLALRPATGPMTTPGSPFASAD